MIQVFKLLKGLEDTDPSVFFETAEGVSTSTRGHSLKLRKKQSNTSMNANAFANRVINDWNALPEAATECTTINQFKTCLEETWHDRTSRYVPY